MQCVREKPAVPFPGFLVAGWFRARLKEPSENHFKLQVCAAKPVCSPILQGLLQTEEAGDSDYNADVTFTNQTSTLQMK